MKNYKNILFSLIIAFFFVSASYAEPGAGGLTKESCDTGIYKEYYANSCNTCGYFNDGIHRIYKDKPKDYWDFYINVEDKETVFSSRSITVIEDTGNFLNDEVLEAGTGLLLKSSWVKPDIEDDEAVIFSIDDLIFNNSSGALRAEPVGVIEYNLRGAPTSFGGDITKGPFVRSYAKGTETLQADGTWNLTTEVVSIGTGSNSFYSSDIFEHKECYAILPAWCGDGVIDSVYGEKCDPADPLKKDWGTAGCDVNSCKPITTTCDSLTATPTSAQNSLITTLTCTGYGDDQFEIDCGNGTVLSGTGILTGNGTGNYLEYNYTNTCSYNTVGSYAPTCTIQGNVTGGSCQQTVDVTTPGGGTPGCGSNCGSSSGNKCGNGRIDAGEDCDYGSLPKSEWGSICSSSCQFKGGGFTPDGNGEISLPGGGSLILGPIDYVTVGNDMNPYVTYGLESPFIENRSNFVFNFDELCVAKHSGDNILGANPQCRKINKNLEANERIKFSDLGASRYPDFKGTISNLSAQTGENALVTTVKHDGTVYSNSAFLSRQLKIRVSKPSIATTGGGTSYIKNTSGISNLNKVGVKNPGKDKNFIGAGVSTGDISSFSKTVSDGDTVSKIGSEGTKFNSGSLVFSETGDTSSFRSYNGIENAEVIRDTTFTIDYDDNIAFVVKGGNITIGSNVSSLDGTYIAIPVNNIGGDIKGGTVSTNTQLQIKGSLYGNTTHLVSKRTYIKEKANGTIDVGTIVSFGSSIFRDPAPLTRTFIDEYIEATKVAQ